MNRRALLLGALLVSACGTDVTGPSESLFSCVLADPRALSTGEVLQVRGAGNQAICLTGPGEVAEFVYIPFFAADPPGEDEQVRLAVELSGGGFQAVTGPPSPSPTTPTPPALLLASPGASVDAAGPREDAAFHLALRARELRELGPKLRAGGRARPGTGAVAPGERAGTGASTVAGVPVPAAAPSQGDLVEYNVAISCTAEDLRTGRVEYVSEHAVVVADVQNPGTLTATDYRHFALTFDTVVHPLAVRHFGEPTDIDGNGRAILFFTRAVNELTPRNSESFTAGFFWSGDLFPEEDMPRAQGCRAANQAEMFYLLSPDPSGSLGMAFSADFIRGTSIRVIAHEYQHLINAARRLWVNEAMAFEEVWLNEGLSHAAEELLFYELTGLESRSNLTVPDLRARPGGDSLFNIYMGGNLTNYAIYLARPDTSSLMGIDRLPTRGASWSFVRYAADRSGRADEDFFFDLVNGTEAGLENLREVLGTSPLAWMQDWTVSVYADDAVEVPARFTQPSWNFREIFPRTTVQRFPLAVVQLDPGEAEVLSLHPGGAAFARFGVAAGGRAVVHVDSDGGDPPASLRGSLLRTR